MNYLFASLYQYLVYHQVYSVFLDQQGVYFPFGLIALIPPLILFAGFYFLVKYPWCKFWHWLLVLAASLLTIGILSYNMLAKNLAQFIFDPTNYPGAKTFLFSMLAVNLLFGLISSFIFTLIFKQFHLPQRNIPWGGKK